MLDNANELVAWLDDVIEAHGDDLEFERQTLSSLQGKALHQRRVRRRNGERDESFDLIVGESEAYLYVGTEVDEVFAIASPAEVSRLLSLVRGILYGGLVFLRSPRGKVMVAGTGIPSTAASMVAGSVPVETWPALVASDEETLVPVALPYQ